MGKSPPFNGTFFYKTNSNFSRSTAALLHRLTHHAHIIEPVDQSYRFRQPTQQM
jgi:hypothetical protein